MSMGGDDEDELMRALSDLGDSLGLADPQAQRGQVDLAQAVLCELVAPDRTLEGVRAGLRQLHQAVADALHLAPSAVPVLAPQAVALLARHYCGGRFRLTWAKVAEAALRALLAGEMPSPGPVH